MALSDIGLCGRALIRIGAQPITSFHDGSAEAMIAEQLFGSVRDAVLSSYGWSFALRQVALTQHVTPPAADYSHAYQLPTDFLRALSGGSGGSGRGLAYRIAADRLEANADTVTLTYIGRPTSESFPPYFDMALIARLSAEFCIPVTENVSRTEALHRLADLEIKRARQIDSQQATTRSLHNFNLVTIRR